MSAEIVNGVIEAARNVSYATRLKDLATAHPIGAVVAGTVVATVAVVGGYKLCTKLFGEKKKEEPKVTVNVNAAPPVDPVVKTV